MIFAVVYGIVIDSVRRAEGCPAVGAARKHHISPRVKAGWSHSGDHVNVVVSRAAGTVNGNEDLPGESVWVNGWPVPQAASHVDCCDLIKSRGHSRVLRVARPNAPKTSS